MKYLSIILIIIFYIFFFLRAFLLKKTIGKKIKADNPLLNFSIFTAGFTSLLFLFQICMPSLEQYLFIIFKSVIMETTGTIFIAAGLIVSSLASLNLGKSWRIGVDSNEKTDLVTSGIYSFSRNPYFLSYDIVLIGVSLVSLSILVIIFSLTTMLLFHFMILKEEKYLEETHSTSYIEYKKSVRRYL